MVRSEQEEFFKFKYRFRTIMYNINSFNVKPVENAIFRWEMGEHPYRLFGNNKDGAFYDVKVIEEL